MIFRKRDYHKSTKVLLEDKIFVIMEATNYSGELIEYFEGGRNKWMTQTELQSQEKHFTSAYKFVDLLQSDTHYIQQDHFYDSDEY